MEIVESDHYVVTASIAKKLKIAQKVVWKNLNRAAYRKKKKTKCRDTTRVNVKQYLMDGT